MIADDLALDHYEPVYFFEFDVYDYDTFVTNVGAGAYFSSFANIYSWIDAAFLDAGYILPSVTLISSMKSDEGFYVQAGTSAECIATPGTFYFDTTTKGCWIHRFDNNNPRNYPLLYGATHGYSKGPAKPYYNDIEYDGRLKSIPNISRSKSDYYTATSRNEGGTVIMSNADGELDTLAKDQTVLGNACRCKIGLSHYNYESFYTSFTGFIRKVTPGKTDVRFEIKQNIEKLKIPVPPNSYRVADLIYLDDGNDGKPIPLVYGSVRDHEVVCLNETESTPTFYAFRVADTTYHSIKAIDHAYVYIDDIQTEVTIASTDLDAGTFTLAAADYDPGQKVTVDMRGFVDGAGDLIENALDVIKDLIVNFTSARDTALYFNTSYWDDTAAYTVGLAIDDDTDIEKVIEEITQKGTLAHFQIDDDGRYSCVIFDSAGAIDHTLGEYDLTEVGEPEYDQSQLVSELVINYDRQISSGKPRVLVNTDYKEDNNWLYETFSRKTIETIISGAGDAADFGEAFQALYGVPRTTVDVTTSLMTALYRIGARVQIPFARPKSIDIGTYKCEVIGVSTDFDNNKSTLKVRLYEEVT